MNNAHLVNQKSFIVKENTEKGGILPHNAMIKYGTSMLSLAEAYPLFGNDKNWARYKDGSDGLQNVRPIVARDLITPFVGISAAEAIEKYKTTNEGVPVLAYTENVNGAKFTLLRSIPTKEILISAGLSMETKNVALDVNEGWVAKDLGDNTIDLSFRYPQLEKAMILPCAYGPTTTDQLPVLFGSNGKKLNIQVGFHRTKTDGRHLHPVDFSIGLAAVGFDHRYINGPNLPHSVMLVSWLSTPIGVLTAPEMDIHVL